jgi:hypothetical protein
MVNIVTLVLHTGQKEFRGEIFHKVEPYLTFLDTSVRKTRCNIQSKVEELEEINQSGKS